MGGIGILLLRDPYQQVNVGPKHLEQPVTTQGGTVESLRHIVDPGRRITGAKIWPANCRNDGAGAAGSSARRARLAKYASSSSQMHGPIWSLHPNGLPRLPQDILDFGQADGKLAV